MTENHRGKCRNIYCMKLLCAVLTVNGIVFIILYLLDTSKRSNQRFLLYNTIETNNEPHNTDHKVLNVQDVSTEILLLQNGHLPESINWTKSKVLLENMELWLQRNLNLRERSSREHAKGVTDYCKPINHIFFLKTHKTASSTIMNILFRYGEFHNLTFAFPLKNERQFFYPKYFNASFVEGYSQNSNISFHIMCHHMRFLLTEKALQECELVQNMIDISISNLEGLQTKCATANNLIQKEIKTLKVEKVMPSNTFYFTILRNPVSQMESSFSYYKALDIFAEVTSLEAFLNNTSKYYRKSSKTSNHAKNFMTFDLGFDHNGLESVKHFQLNWRAVEATFNIVLITEYFDESLVLLKDALCWTLDDVLSFRLNSRSNTTKKALSKQTQEAIKRWNQLDWQLYVYFNSTFWNRVERFGKERMLREVEELRRRRAEMQDICLHGEVDPDKMIDKSLKPFQAGIARILGYNLKSNLGKADQLMCKRLITPEIQYSQHLFKRQRTLIL